MCFSIEGCAIEKLELRRDVTEMSKRNLGQDSVLAAIPVKEAICSAVR